MRVQYSIRILLSLYELAYKNNQQKQQYKKKNYKMYNEWKKNEAKLLRGKCWA